jgi:hypothetical protein
MLSVLLWHELCTNQTVCQLYSLKEGVFVDEITALSILTQTLEQCINDYTPAAEVFAALEFLATRTPVKWPFMDFRQGLQTDDETRRRSIIQSALAAIKLLLRVQHRR